MQEQLVTEDEVKRPQSRRFILRALDEQSTLPAEWDKSETAMNASRIFVTLSGLSFREAVWLFPAATGLHFVEEAPNFAKWAQAHASPLYTASRWQKIHVIGMAYAIAFTSALVLITNPYATFLFFAFCFAPVFFNTLFHLGATLFFRSYCPGLVTALSLYPVLFWYLSSLAHREGLLSLGAGVVAFIIAAVIHACDVAASVFLVKLPWGSKRA